MKTHSKLVTGPILILMGVLLLVGQSIHWHAFSFLWLLVLLAAGVVMLVLYGQGRRHPALLSAGVLVTLLSLHFFALRWGWVQFNSSWPFFLLAPGLAFLSVAAADRQNKDALAPAITLISISVICYLFTLGILAWILRVIISVLRVIVRYLLPLGLMAWGVLLLVERRDEREFEGEIGGVPPAPSSPDDGTASSAEPTPDSEPAATVTVEVEEVVEVEEPSTAEAPGSGTVEHGEAAGIEPAEVEELPDTGATEGGSTPSSGEEELESARRDESEPPAEEPEPDKDQD